VSEEFAASFSLVTQVCLRRYSAIGPRGLECVLMRRNSHSAQRRIADLHRFTSGQGA